MSGGSLDYAYDKMNDIANQVKRRAETPLHRAFAKHLEKVATALRDLEWVLSCDYSGEVDAIKACLPKDAILNHCIEEANQAAENLRAAIEEAKTAK